MNPQALLLDDDIRRRCAHLETRSERDWPQGAVRRDRDVVCFGHRRDLADFRDAAGMGEIRLDDVDIAVLQNLLEIPARKHSLAGRDRYRRMSGNLTQRLVVLRQDRLLDEEQVERFELLRHHLGHGLVQPAVEIHADTDAGADYLTRCGDAFDDSFYFGERIDIVHLFRGAHLQSRKSSRHLLLRMRSHIRRPVTTNPRVDPNLLTDWSTQELVDRQVVTPALDIPEGLI